VVLESYAANIATPCPEIKYFYTIFFFCSGEEKMVTRDDVRMILDIYWNTVRHFGEHVLQVKELLCYDDSDYFVIKDEAVDIDFIPDEVFYHQYVHLYKEIIDYD